MNVLFLFVNLPNLDKGGNLYSDLVNQFVRFGHHVCAASIGDNEKVLVSNENGVRVLRIPARKTTQLSGVKKALNYQHIAMQFAFLVPKYFKCEKFEVIISHTLPPEIGLASWWLKKKFHCLHYLILSDFLWQDGVSLGMFGEQNPICLYYKLMENIMFRHADLFAAPSKATIDFSKKYYKNFDENKCEILRWWEDASICHEHKEQVRKQYRLEDKFVVIYGGSVGLMQKGDYFLDLAKSVQDYEDILFLLVGRGDYLLDMKQQSEAMGIKNIRFQNFLPQQEYNRLLSVCNIGLIILNENVGTPNIPSKLVSYYAYGIPVLASVDPITDLLDVLKEDNTGLGTMSGRTEELKSLLIKMFQNPKLCSTMSENEKRIYENEMKPSCAYEKIKKQIDNYLNS